MLAVVSLALGIAALGFTTQNGNQGELVVHEWGTFTSIAGRDGMALEWRPLAATNDLPGFVYEFAAITNGSGLRHDCTKCDLTGKIRMETPVLYFYADHDADVSVRVDFPKGKITEWYPSARMSVGSSIDWGHFAVMPHTTTNLLTEPGPNRYYAARETDAALVRVCNTNGRATEFEKFLFYRGVGAFDLPISVVLDGNRLQFTGLMGIDQVIVFENQGGNIGFRIVHLSSDTATVERPALGDSRASLLTALQQTLVAHGLYEKEARAMIETWRDSWLEEGLRVFYVLPRPVTDTMLPITIDPRPNQLVRVLVGRTEIITTEREAAARAGMRGLDDPSAEVRTAARAALRKQGRFMEPVLKQMLAGEHGDADADLVKLAWVMGRD